MRPIAIVVVIAGLLVLAFEEPTAAVTAQRTRVDSAGIELRVPNGWKPFPPTSNGQNPVFAASSPPAAGWRSTLNVLVRSTDALPASAADFRESLSPRLAPEAAQSLSITSRRVDHQDGYRVSWGFMVTNDRHRVINGFNEWLVVHTSEGLVIITIATRADASGRKQARTVLSSVQIV